METLMVVLIALAAIGWVYYLWQWLTGNWEVSRSFQRCSECLGVIQPGDRIWRKGRQVRHFQH